MEWISVKDRLPEEDGEYIVCVNWLTVSSTTLTFWNIPNYPRWLIASNGANMNERVTHWMPLPKPPKP